MKTKTAIFIVDFSAKYFIWFCFDVAQFFLVCIKNVTKI